jgi:hypothetical protein
MDLFDNSVSFVSWSATLTSLAFFRAKAGFSSAKMLFFIGSCSETEVSEQL